MSSNSPSGKNASSSKLNFISARPEAEALLVCMANRALEMSAISDVMSDAILEAKALGEPQLAELAAMQLSDRNALERWAEENKSDLFQPARSMQCLHGRFGFRLNPKSLALLAKTKWEHVLGRLRNGLSYYIRTSEEVDKKQLLSDATADNPVISRAQLSELGVKVVQEDEFFVELKGL